jgi:hypothetical protein
LVAGAGFVAVTGVFSVRDGFAAACAGLDVAGAAVGVASASQVCTPPCLEHAPFLVFADEYVPSLQSAVAFAGFEVFADAENPTRSVATTHEAESKRRMVRIFVLQSDSVTVRRGV